MIGASKQEEDIDNQRVSDGVVEKHSAKGNEKKDEENDPEQTCVLADDTSLRQEMDEKALPEIAIFEKPSSWLEDSLNEEQPSTVSRFSVCRSILHLPLNNSRFQFSDFYCFALFTCFCAV